MSGPSFYPRELNCTLFECNLTKDGRNCTINHENDYSRIIKDIWVCNDKYSNGLITAKASCYGDKVYPDSYCRLSYHSNGSLGKDLMGRIYPDFPTNPSPPANDFKPLYSIFYIILLIIFYLAALALLISYCTNSVSQTNSQHSQPCEDNFVENNQQFCDNPDHFIIDNEAPPSYDSMINSYNESTPLLSTTRPKRCIRSNCANYLKPFKINKEYSRGRYQSATITSPSCSNTNFLINIPNKDNTHHGHKHCNGGNGHKSHHNHCNHHNHQDECNDHKPHHDHHSHHSHHHHHHTDHSNSSRNFSHQNTHGNDSTQISNNSNNDHHVSYQNHDTNTDNHTSFDHHDSAFDSHYD